MCRRDGSWTDTKVSELVMGDLIQLKGGDVIPADAKVDNQPPLLCTRQKHALQRGAQDSGGHELRDD